LLSVGDSLETPDGPGRVSYVDEFYAYVLLDGTAGEVIRVPLLTGGWASGILCQQ
jgi:hypothetical protein